METEKQEKYRVALIEKYEQRAFECLALYNYYGRHYQAIENQCKEMDKRIDEAEKKIEELDKEPGSKENYEAKRALEEDVKKYEKQIASVGDFAQKFQKQAVAYQEEGGRLLEQIDEFKMFKLKTPEQIEADKHAKVAEQPQETNA